MPLFNRTLVHTYVLQERKITLEKEKCRGGNFEEKIHIALIISDGDSVIKSDA